VTAAGSPPVRSAPTMDPARTWTVLLLGGASGVGKSQISRRLARHFDAEVTAVDDIYLALERMTSPEQYPEVHRWRLSPEEVLGLDDEGMLDHALGCASVVAEALEPVIAEHLESSEAAVFDGDFLLPSLAAKSSFDDVPADGRVSALFLLEDEQQLARNFLAREGHEQARRARASWRYSEHLRQECARFGIHAIEARPWDTVLDRAIDAIRP
jgi:2-phosphoglycerate kinase